MNQQEFKRWLIDSELMLEHRGYTSIEIDKILEFFTNIKGSNEIDLIGTDRVDSFVKFIDGEYFDCADGMTARLFIYAPHIVGRLPTRSTSAIEAAVLAASAPTLPVVEDGENQAIRMFLMRHAGSDAVTTKQMREHLTMAGYEGCWPDWANTDQHLTKAGAQLWIRYLISLERDVLQSLAEETETLGLYDDSLQASQSPQDQVKP